jgi:hypothetical protein
MKYMKLTEAEKFYIIAFVLVIIFMIPSYFEITGFATTDVSLGAKMEGIITHFAIQNSSIFVFQNQSVEVEFMNSGSLFMNRTQTNISIYRFENNEINLSKYYFSPTLPLAPGSRTFYKVNFIPNETGVFYVRARVTFDSRNAEIWSVYLVSSLVQSTPGPGNVTNATPGPETPGPSSGGEGEGQGQGGGGGGAPVISEPGEAPGLILIKPESGISGLEISYPSVINISQNQRVVIPILINNSGETDIHDLKLFISTTNQVDVNINPKVLAILKKGGSTIFLLTIATSIAEPGEYAFDFSLISDETKVSKKAVINILPSEIPLDEDLRSKILSYKFIIVQIESEIFSSSLDGYDVGHANSSLNLAKEFLKKGEIFYNEGNLEKSREELDKVRKNIEDSVFLLAHAKLVTFARPSFPIYLIILMAIIAGAIWYWAKRKGRRPKMIRNVTEE